MFYRIFITWIKVIFDVVADFIHLNVLLDDEAKSLLNYGINLNLRKYSISFSNFECLNRLSHMLLIFNFQTMTFRNIYTTIFWILFNRLQKFNFKLHPDMYQAKQVISFNATWCNVCDIKCIPIFKVKKKRT